MSKKPDLTSKDNVAKGQKVYADLMSGKTRGAKEQLDKAYGRKG